MKKKKSLILLIIALAVVSFAAGIFITLKINGKNTEPSVDIIAETPPATETPADLPDVTEVPETTPPPVGESTLRNITYYGDWSIWGGQGNYYPVGIPADQLTHLNFAFLDFDASGNLIFTDKDAAIGAPVGMDDVQWGAANAGILSALLDLRAKNPNLKIGVSIGGWSKSGDFSTVAADPTIRKTFVDNLIRFFEYTSLDFLDVDWEYPCAVRSPDNVDNINDEGTPLASSADKDNYITLLKDLRSALDTLGATHGRYFELSVALSASKSILASSYDIPALFETVDFANIMTYDLHGAWEPISGHQSALYTNPKDPSADKGLSIHDNVQFLLSQGAPPNKIVIGAAFYTRGWEKVADNGGISGLPGLFGSAEQVNNDGDQTPSYGAQNENPIKSGEGGRCSGIWSYGSLDKLKASYSGLTEYWDYDAKAPYLYNEQTGAFFTYDNQRSVQEKASYVLENNLGGVISWMQSQDAATNNPSRRDELTTQIKSVLFGESALPSYEIRTPNLDISLNISTYEDTSGKGYELVITNNESLKEQGEVLSGVETAYKSLKYPTVYIKTSSGAVFSSGGYGSGTVTNEDGCGIADLSSVYDNKIIAPGSSVTLRLKSDGAADLSDVVSVWLTQKIMPSGAAIGTNVLYGDTSVSNGGSNSNGTDNSGTSTAVSPAPAATAGSSSGTSSDTFDPTEVYVQGDTVTYNGKTYKAKWWTQGDTPGASEWGPWESISQ